MSAKSISKLNQDLNNFANSSMLVGSPKLSKVKDGVKYWTQEISGYPIPFSHFRRLRWPHEDSGFLTIEFLALEVLKESGLASKRFTCRAHDHDWKALSGEMVGLYILTQEVEKTLNKWYETDSCPKTKLASLTRFYNSKGFPDVIDFHKKKPQCWEIKAPYDLVTKDQTEALKLLYSELGVEANILSFKFLDPKEHSDIKDHRRKLAKAKDDEAEKFYKSPLRIKLEKYFRKHCHSNIARRLRSQPSLGRFHHYTSISGASEAVMDLYPAYFKSPDEMLRLLYDTFVSNYEDVDYEDLKSELPLSKSDIHQLSLYFYNMGYYKWWIVPILFYPYLEKFSKDKKVKELIETALLFNRVFNSKIDIYSLGEKSRGKIEKLIPQFYTKIMNYEKGRMW